MTGKVSVMLRCNRDANNQHQAGQAKSTACAASWAAAPQWRWGCIRPAPVSGWCTMKAGVRLIHKSFPNVFFFFKYRAKALGDATVVTAVLLLLFGFVGFVASSCSRVLSGGCRHGPVLGCELLWWLPPFQHPEWQLRKTSLPSVTVLDREGVGATVQCNLWTANWWPLGWKSRQLRENIWQVGL